MERAASSPNPHLDAALAWARAGWRVFLLVPGTKKPFFQSHGFIDATNDERQIVQWWTAHPDANIGVRTGEGLVVVDIDVRHGKNGWASLATVGITPEMLNNMDTFTVTSPSNGSHFWFHSDEAVGSGTDVLGKDSGVDIRGEGGYIVVPPSIRPEGQYAVASCGNACDADGLPRLSKLANWSALGGKIHRPVPPPPPPRPEIPIDDAEMRWRVDRAKAYLAKCDGAVSGQGGHNRTFAVTSALVNGFLLPPDVALNLLLGDYNPRCSPPWSEQEFKHKVESAITAGPPEGKTYGWLLGDDAGSDMHGNDKPDRRAVTSPQNGAAHKETDWKLAAQEFVSKTGHAVQWRREGFYVYEPKIGAYRPRTDKELGAMISAFLPAALPNGQTVKCSANAERNILVALRATDNLDLLPPCFLSTGKPAGGWVAMHNGLLDIEAAARGEPIQPLRHSADFFSTFARPFDWEPDAQCPMWENLLAEAAPDPENRDMLQMLAGLALTDDVNYQVFFDLYGSGNNGKGVYKAVLQALIGLENICRIPLSDFTEKFVVGELTQKRLNMVGDTETADTATRYRPMGALEGILKEVTGGVDATMKLEPKGVQADTARPVTARCVFLTNTLTPWIDRTNAIWRRWRLIPFTVTIPEEKIDKDLANKIISQELPGVFAWAVRGLGKLRQHRTFPQSKAGQAIKDGHREVCDREGSFLRERYEVVQGGSIEVQAVYSAYRSWCEENGIQGILTKQNFSPHVLRVFAAANGQPGVEMGRAYFGRDGQAKTQQRAFINLACKKTVVQARGMTFHLAQDKQDISPYSYVRT